MVADVALRNVLFFMFVNDRPAPFNVRRKGCDAIDTKLAGSLKNEAIARNPSRKATRLHTANAQVLKSKGEKLYSRTMLDTPETSNLDDNVRRSNGNITLP